MAVQRLGLQADEQRKEMDEEHRGCARIHKEAHRGEEGSRLDQCVSEVMIVCSEDLKSFKYEKLKC